MSPSTQTVSRSRQLPLVGTTGQLYSGSVAATDLNKSGNAVSPEHETTDPIRRGINTSFPPTKYQDYFKSLQWSADGTTLLTASAACTLQSFVLPPALLHPPQPHPLKPYTTHILPEPAYATALLSSYNLAEPSTCLFLASIRNLPIRLCSTLGGGVLGSYPLVSPTTEAYIAPHSLHFSSTRPNELLAGSNGFIAVFDISRPGEGPADVMRTGRKGRRRGARLGSQAIIADNGGEAGDGLRGIVSAMDTSNDGLLAAGTFSRNVGLYDGHGRGATNAIFSMHDHGDGDVDEDDTKGNGITQVVWDDSGRYLCVAERGSDGISIWDIRGTKKRLAWLQGRKANTQQRMGTDVLYGEVWAGGTDGVVRVWEGMGMKEGAIDSDWQFTAHNDAINGIGLHPTGTVLATCSGQRHYAEDDYEGKAVTDLNDGCDSQISDTLPGSFRAKLSIRTERELLGSNAFDNTLNVWAL